MSFNSATAHSYCHRFLVVSLFVANCLVGGVLAGSAYEEDPSTGTWKLVPEKSTYKNIPKFKELTLTSSVAGDKRTLDFRGTNQDGSPFAIRLVEPIHGGRVEGPGGPDLDTAILKVIDAHHDQVIYSKAGKLVGKRDIIVKGNVMTANCTMKLHDGKTAVMNDYWEKQ